MARADRGLRVEWVPVGEVRPYDRNPRTNDGAVPLVAESIREFGWQQPIVVDADGTVIAGHTRLKAAKQLGLERVPVVRATGLTPEQVQAYRLADNKVAEAAEWDLDLLGGELDGLLDFDMGRFGFDELGMDGLTDEFELADGDGPQYKSMSLGMTEEQFRMVEAALDEVDRDSCALQGGNVHGDKVAEVVRQWRALRTSSSV